MPIGQRQYQMAIALPGQRMSYQDHTHYKGHLDGTYNAEPELLPFGRFIAKSTDVTPFEGGLKLPSAAHTAVIGLIPQQGYYERNCETGEVGIPVNYPTAYAYQGVFAVEFAGVVDINTAIEIAADDTDEANKGKLVDSAVYANNSIPLPGDWVIKRVVDNLVIIEIDFSPTLIKN